METPPSPQPETEEGAADHLYHILSTLHASPGRRDCRLIRAGLIKCKQGCGLELWLTSIKERKRQGEIKTEMNAFFLCTHVQHLELITCMCVCVRYGSSRKRGKKDGGVFRERSQFYLGL